MPLNEGHDPPVHRERIAGPHVRAVVVTPVALRAAGASWIRHWETVLAPALGGEDGKIVWSATSFSDAEIDAVAPDPVAAFRAIVDVLDAAPERATT